MSDLHQDAGPTRRHQGATRRESGWWALLVPIAALLSGLSACGSDGIDPRVQGADPGQTVELRYRWPTADGEVPLLTDVTEEWGLGGFENKAEAHAAGGIAIDDLDGDGWPDLAVAGGDLEVFYGSSTGMIRGGSSIVPETGQASSVGLADLDGDTLLDVVIGVIGGDDLILWGGSASTARDLSQTPRTRLPGGNETVAVMAADLGGDEQPDVLRLSHDPAEPDIIWVQTGSRVFVPEPLPQSYRRSFAAEIVDLDQDGLLDIWVTRDVGWISGADSIYTRRGASQGSWIDVASEVGAALAIDGMGIALADLNGDGALDAYVTDIGENDILFAVDGGFVPASSTGAGRIRPPGYPAATVSSSWAATVGDVNLDGIVDLLVANGGFGNADIPNKVPGTEIVDLDTPAVFLGLGNGQFADIWPLLDQPWMARIRGMALGDLDRDGDSDLIFVSSAGGMRAYRNDWEGSSVTLVVPEASCAAGFVATVTSPSTSYRSVLMQHPFLGSNEPLLVVGTANAAVEVTVVRPGRATFTSKIPAGSGRITIEIPCK